MKQRENKSKHKISKVEVTADTLTGRGGMGSCGVAILQLVPDIGIRGSGIIHKKVGPLQMRNSDCGNRNLNYQLGQ